LNSAIWARIPKSVFVRLDTLKFGVYDAVLCFNDGVAKRNDVLNILGVRLAHSEWSEEGRYGKDLDGRNSNTEHLEKEKSKIK
jgi:hypothetical protein